jgi:hypothetical protein
MLQERNLLYFDPFYFPNGKSAPKPKYFIVLKVDPDDVILGALPTRKDSVPMEFDSKSGCIQMNEPGNVWTCYRIDPHDSVLEDAQVFPFDFYTHIYPFGLDLYSLTYFSIYSIENRDYKIVGKIRQDVYEELVDCFVNSPATKNKYKKKFYISSALSPKADSGSDSFSENNL